MRHDYKPFIYKMVKWHKRWRKLMDMDNLFEKYLIICLLTAVAAVFAEFIIVALTEVVFMGVNFIRVIEYEPTVNFKANNFSVLVLGNFFVLLLVGGYFIGAGIKNFCVNISDYVTGAEQEIKDNSRLKQDNK